MEDKKLVTLAIIFCLLLLPFIFKHAVFSYDDKTTHSALTQEIVKLFNSSFPEKKFNNEEVESIIKGSIDEDQGIRSLWHFYDPVYQRGLVLEESQIGENNQLVGVGLAPIKKEWESSKEWAQNTKLQAGAEEFSAGITKPFFSGESDYSWDRAIYEYAWGDKTRGLESLGHILHLIEDATVPDHTRNDPHPPFSHFGSPYEYWAKKFDRQSIHIVETLTNQQPIIRPSLNDYFDAVASYSNNNFFSKDTIFKKEYESPAVVRWEEKQLGDGLYYDFGYSKDNIPVVARKNTPWQGIIDENYLINDPDEIILNNYWSRLSTQAVLNGTGVIKLFFDEVEKEKQTKTLYEKNRSWFAQLQDSIIGKVSEWKKSLAGGIASLFVGANQTAEQPIPPVEHPATQANPPEKATSTIASTISQTTKPSLPATSPLLPQQNEKQSGPQSPSFIFGGGGPPNPPQALPTFPNENHSPPEDEGGISATTTPPSASSTSPFDTTPPDITFSIAECADSLSLEGCLLTATTTLHLSWSSSADDLQYFNISCTSQNAPCVSFPSGTTTATSTSYVIPLEETIVFALSALDTSGNASVSINKEIAIALHPVVVNEIAWMGTGTSASTSKDEWLELFDPTPFPINLAGWTLSFLLPGTTTPSHQIELSGTIPAKGFYLIERTDDTTISDIPADLTASFGNGLLNTGMILRLEHHGSVMDRTPDLCSGQWCAGSALQSKTMERISPRSSGEFVSNWGTHDDLGAGIENGSSSQGNRIRGTPKRRNGLNYLIAPICCSVAENRTLKKEDSPFIISPRLIVESSTTLTIEAGVIVKIVRHGLFPEFFPAIDVRGAMIARGTDEEPIIFTSIHDDAFGGDTNGNGTTTEPKPGDWGTLLVHDSSTTSIFQYASIRYGGKFAGGPEPRLQVTAMFGAVSAHLEMDHATLEYSQLSGADIIASEGIIKESIFRKNGIGFGAGIFLRNGRLLIHNNLFEENFFGMDIFSGPHEIIGNRFVKNHAYALGFESHDPAGGPLFKENIASENRLNGTITREITEDYTFEKDLPYLYGFSVSPGKTVRIRPGVIFKFVGTRISEIGGTLLAEGTQEEPIIITSEYDDEFGGDTENDGPCNPNNASSTALCPQPGDWATLHFQSTSASSTIQYALIRYGSTFALSTGAHPLLGAIEVDGTSINIANATLEKNRLAGLLLTDSASTTISSSVFRDHQGGPAISLTRSNATLTDVTFENNFSNISKDDASTITQTTYSEEATSTPEESL